MGATERLAERIANTRLERLSAATRTVATQAILDYLGVTLAGADEPLTRLLLELSEEEGGRPQATLIGLARKATVRQAALINGAAGHAHDYDDVHDAMTGHPTVPVAPVVLALGESLGSSGAEIVTAFVAGVETECILGRYAGASHYAQGWHATGTLGTFGAAAAASRLLRLDVEQTARALGIAGTQAAGLKSQFGTMCKPFHAGHAAATGLEAAQLAARGFGSRPDILETGQGFMATHSSEPSIKRFDAALMTAEYLPAICFKYHAACYLTHSAIEATRTLVNLHRLNPTEIDQVDVYVNQTHFGVCNIPSPRTGLEVKFSLRHTVAMALSGADTADIRLFTDALANRDDLVALRDRITVHAHPKPQASTRVSIRMRDGATVEMSANVGRPANDLELQWERLGEKFMTLASPCIGRPAASQVMQACRHLEELTNLASLLEPLWIRL